MDRTALNSRLWLYHGPQKNDSVVISAHGGYEKGTMAFDLRVVARYHPTNVYFWTRHGYASTMKLGSALGADPMGFAKSSGLSKREVEASSTGSRMVLNYEIFSFGEARSDIDALEEQASAAGRDIIVVRRDGPLRRSHVYLKEVIEAAQRVHAYTRFYCTFCRVLMGDGIKFQTYTADEEGIVRSDARMGGGWKKAEALSDHGWEEEDYTFL